MNLEYGEIIKRTDLKGTPDELFVDGFKQGVAAGVEEVKNAMYDQCFENDNDPNMLMWNCGMWIRFKLFENVIEKLLQEVDA